ncbi:hypothetical protein [Clostridium isatidis]|uniref:hypothetical protein n=1 Tax=Clostridium isatidis TaxID=182773 RepID=UPI003AB01E20
MDFYLKRKLIILRDDFNTGNWNLKTFQKFMADIRYSILNISQHEFIELMTIPKELFKGYIYLKDYSTWQISNKSYFLKNIKIFNEEFFVKLADKIYKLQYSLEDIVETIDFIGLNFNVMRKNYGKKIGLPLKNIEEILRECVVINNEQLIKLGPVFAERINRVLNMKS